MKAINPREPARATSRAIVMAAADGSGDSDLRQRQLVLVYGTLKRGQPNHHQLGGSPCRGEARLAGLALFDLGPFPMAVASAEADASLLGELYALSAEQLAALDRFEGAPRLYERQRHTLADGRAVWVYVGRARQVRHVARIASGVWLGRRAVPMALVLPGLLLPGLWLGPAASAGDLRRDCRAWESSRGAERVAIANRIGREQLLTKDHQLAEVQASPTTSLYRWNDIRRLCRSL